MTSAIASKGGLLFGLLGAVGAYLWVRRRADGDAEPRHPAPAFAGEGAAMGAPVHTRDAGPDQMRDAPNHWDKVDEAADESFPASDPPATY